ncbi:hypothetical protein SAMN05421759_1382 [Roseivivax lentus]|uniref:Uncharacterized protein n=1 Tax=Roseivivax lentus TaxID=633194 RepID=A0A1N7Q8P7_9RHOB|nr:hypothetical protein SAMN05421759_1382 [Roseivivax lentus]
MASGKPFSPSITRQAISERNLPRGHNRDQDVLRAPVLQLVHHREPEFGAFVLRDPQAQNFTLAIACDAERDIHGLVLHRPAVGTADLHPQRVEDHDWIYPLQRPALPFPDLIQNSVGDTADQVGRDLQAIEIEQMGLDVADRQPDRVEPDDLVIHPVDPGLALLHQLRLEAAVPVTGDRHRQFPVLSLENLGRCAVAAIGLAERRALALFIAKMRGQFGTQHPFHELDLQFFHEPSIAEQIFRALHALQQFIQDFFRDGHSCFLSVKHEPDQSYTEGLTLYSQSAV